MTSHAKESNSSPSIVHSIVGTCGDVRRAMRLLKCLSSIAASRSEYKICPFANRYTG